MDDDAEIVAEFLVESHENLDQLDRDLVALEQEPGSRELLSSIFRTIHTIKGTSGFLALGRLEALTHAGENLLSRLRDRKMDLTTEVTEVLLRTVDTVRALLEVIERSGTDQDPTVDVQVVVAELERVLAGGSAPVVAPDPAPVQAVVAPEPVTPSYVDPAPTAPAAAEPAPAAPAPATPPVAAAPPAAAPAAAPAPAAVAEPLDPDADPAPRGVVDSSVRVDIELLDGLVQLVGELVLTRNQIMQRTDATTAAAGDAELVRAAQRLDLVASELQESVMRTRMQPIGQVWSKMPRIVRDLAHLLGREVALEMEGHDTELDRSLLEALRGPLTHLVRNALDHGLEPPEQRVALGKPAAGRLHLRAFHESGQVVVEISDDGRGIDPAVIGAAAVSRGVVTREQLARMEPRDVLHLIFRPGFSTAEQVTNVSGRGVGMDVVRTSIERIGGSVDMLSVVGSGTTCRVRIPLTLAIIPALVIGEADERYAIPQANLVELVRLEGQDLRDNVEVLAGAPVLRLRGRLLPLVSLSETLGRDGAGVRSATDPLTVVVVQSDDVRFGLCVQDVHDTQEIVVKPIGRQLKQLAMYAGATIMGDGRVALILDVGGIARERALTSVETVEPVARVDEADSRALLVLEVSHGRRAALPLTAVSRLEEFDLDRVERSGSVEVVQYRDGILPLVRLAAAIGLPESPPPEEQLSVVVHEEEGRRVGIVIDRVLDVVEEHVVLTEVGRRPGVLGSAVVQDRVTDLVDLDAVVRPVLGARELVGAR
ncbi:chemotaxis protein CheA [Nocardioides sp. Leaf307]|uniref:chemotaxis protein CheA n=1 Tax=Nocardioides sp. Leaf307 TaxID=1736331 RepID=UPI000702D2C4|nr:chemotaxis protein CheA [Nocardioides sp. Leaf307]KQQ39771.1 histidine kinase [Nocardioides sp. Leaf307]